MKKILLFFFILYLTCSNSPQSAGVSIDEDTGTVSGKLVYSDSVPVPDVLVRLYMKKSSESGDYTSIRDTFDMHKSDKAGLFSFDSLHEGKYVVEAIGTLAGSIDTFSIHGADTFHLRLTVCALGSIVGTVDSTVLNRYKSLYVLIPEINKSVAVDSGGHFLFQNLAPFTYTVSLKAGDTLVAAPGCTQTIVVGPWSNVRIDRLGASDANRTVGTPSIPGNLRALWGPERTITLNWDVSVNNSGYILFRYNENTGVFDTIYHGAHTFVVDSNIIPGNSYSYVVRAENSTGISEKSAVLTLSVGKNQNQLSTYSIIAPLHNSVYMTGDSVPYAVTSTDNNESITKIIIRIDNVQARVSETPSCNGKMAPLPEGKHVFRVITVNGAGDSVFSASIKMIVEDKLLGDVNSDRVVDDNDALDVTRYTAGIQLLHFDESVADVDCNGKVIITDALLIARYYMEYIDTLPCFRE